MRTRFKPNWLAPLARGAACLSGTILLLLASSRGEDWPRWRGSALNGISTEKNWSVAWPKEGPPRLWKANVGTGFSAVSVAKGKVYTLGNRDDADTVYCFDAETGKEIWKHSYACPLDAKYYEGGPGSSPTVENDKVYTLSKRGHLFCFDAASGRVHWQKQLMSELGVKKPEWGFAGSPLVQDQLLILNLGGGGVAVEKSTGRIVWSSDASAAGYATPIPIQAGEESAVAIFSSKALLGVRVKDGQELWRHPWETRWDINAADPIPIGNKLFISTFDRGCALLEIGPGAPKVVWANKNIGNHFNSCVYLDGYLYGVDGNTDQSRKDLRCLDARDGSVKWIHEGLGLGSLMAAGNKLIILGERGQLVVAEASPRKYTPLAEAQALGGRCWTAPVLANSRIYCRNAAGDLVCLDVKPK